MVKNLPANARAIRDVSLILGLERSPGVESGNPFQYSHLKNPMDRGAWWTTAHGVAEWDMTERLTHTYIYSLM